MKQQFHNAFVLQLLAERFTPVIHHAGPLYAGSFPNCNTTGNVYLTERGLWLFLGVQCVYTFNHDELAKIASADVVLKHLLASVSHILQYLQEHLQRISEGCIDPVSLIGFYLLDPESVVIDAIALQKLPS